MEATQNITMEPYNIEYYIAKYGTVENLTNDYIGAIDGLRMQYKQYEDNPRKGGRYRREKMEHIRRQAEAIYDELLRVSRAMKDYFAAQAAEASRISTETAETVNVSAEGEKEAETKENCHSDTRIVSDGYGTQYEVTRHWKNGRLESLDVIVLDTQPQTATDRHNRPKVPQIVECIADTPKPRETARKPQNRGIGNTRHSALGANGYAMLDDASATLTAMHVPHECSTADAAYR